MAFHSFEFSLALRSAGLSFFIPKKLSANLTIKPIRSKKKRSKKNSPK